MSAHEVYSSEDDAAAFAAVYQAHSQKLLRYCQYRLHDRHEAEDVVQEAFARAWRTMPVSGPDGSFYPWLRVVAGNLCTDILRRRSRSQPAAVIDLGSFDGGIDQVTDECDRVLVRQALGRLNDRHRSALMMREDQGLTYDQIAERTGVTSGTVESLLWRARQALKREFTVLAGREGCLAVVPAVLLLAGRGRQAARQAWDRVLRRLAGLQVRGDTPLAHTVMAAAAALTVVSGIAVTVGAEGKSHDRSPLDVSDRAPSAVSALPSGAGVMAPAGSPSTGTSAGGAALGGGGVPDAGAVSPGSGFPPPQATSPRPPIRVGNPVIVGPSAAAYAGRKPFTVNVGGVTVGLSPQAITTYAASVAQQVTPPVTALNPLEEHHL